MSANMLNSGLNPGDTDPLDPPLPPDRATDFRPGPGGWEDPKPSGPRPRKCCSHLLAFGLCALRPRTQSSRCKPGLSLKRASSALGSPVLLCLGRHTVSPAGVCRAAPGNSGECRVSGIGLGWLHGVGSNEEAPTLINPQGPQLHAPNDQHHAPSVEYVNT